MYNQQDLVNFAHAESSMANIDADLVCAIISVESGWDMWAARYEPAYKYLVDLTGYADACGITRETETMFQMTSFGLMQIMGGVCRELGHQGQLLQVLDPQINLALGCKKLKNLYQKYGDETKVIAAYNAGSPRLLATGMYENQRYVDRVHQQLTILRKLA